MEYPMAMALQLCTPVKHGFPPVTSLQARRVVVRAASIPATPEGGDEEERISQCLKNLSDSLILPTDFLKTLPNDLQVDVKDAAFALSKGQVYIECGGQVGDVLQQLSKAWEQSDTETAAQVGKNFLTLQGEISKSTNGPALGKRLINAGRHLRSTGQYAQGEFQDIAKALTALGEAVGGKETVPTDISTLPPTLKFGSLQMEITPGRAFSGAAVALVFGVLSWQLGAGVQSVSESSFNYASDNATMVAASLRGTLLAMAYSCAGLSGFTGVGLLVLGLQLSGVNRNKGE